MQAHHKEVKNKTIGQYKKKLQGVQETSQDDVEMNNSDETQWYWEEDAQGQFHKVKPWDSTLATMKLMNSEWSPQCLPIPGDIVKGVFDHGNPVFWTDRVGSSDSLELIRPGADKIH